MSMKHRASHATQMRDEARSDSGATPTAVILRSRALARRLEGRPRALVAHPSRLAAMRRAPQDDGALFGNANANALFFRLARRHRRSLGSGGGAAVDRQRDAGDPARFVAG